MINTVQLNGWIDRMRAGDQAARDELLRATCQRLERLARKMLQRFPSVQRWAETGDVLQNSLLRLLRALAEVRPNSVRDFFGLAAEQMRRELLDLARRFQGARGDQARCESGVLDAEPVAHRDLSRELERWSSFHEEVARLPAEDREVVGLIFYHGWTKEAVAELFQVSRRTVQRRWDEAMLKLSSALNRMEP